MRLTQFEFVVVHQPGASNIADYFSRHPDEQADLTALVEEQELEFYINYVLESAIPDSIGPAELLRETMLDDELKDLRTWLAKKNRSTMPATSAPFKRVIDKISESNGLLMRGRRFIVPKTMKWSAS